MTVATPPQPWWEQPLPLARYRFVAQALDPIELPPFTGSLLRGQFGAHLRALCCTTGAPKCSGCPQIGQCAYSRVFDGALAPDGPHADKGYSQVPNPYVIAPPAGGRTLLPGENLEFGMVLVGHATSQLPLIAAAWHQALAQGLGTRRARARLTHVQWLDNNDKAQTLWTPASGHHMAPHTPVLQVPPPAWLGGVCTLQLLTPLRLQQQSGLVGANALTAHILLSALGRRVALLLEMHGGLQGVVQQAKQLHEHSHHLQLQTDLHWHDWIRYSARQRQEMTLGGLLGTITLRTTHIPTAQALWPWLWLGQWLRAGKNATLGLGQYRVLAETSTCYP